MKKTYLFQNVMSSLICVLSLWALTSCTNDEISDTSIFGTWSCTDHYYGGTDTYVFKKNGTYNWFYNGTADWFTDENGTYTFNGTTLTTTKTAGRTVTYVVLGISQVSLVIMNEDGYQYCYYRK